MAENPFIDFFSSMAAGAEAGRERKTLLQRAQKGQVSQDEVPGMAATILQGIGRATMTPNERANQDQIKMQMLNARLDQKMRTDAANLQEQKFAYQKLQDSEELERQKGDIANLGSSLARMDQLVADGDIEGLRAFQPEQRFSSMAARTEFEAQKSSRLKSDRSIRITNLRELQKEYANIGGDPTDMTAAQLEREIDNRTASAKSGIGLMVEDYNRAIELGDDESAAMILPSIQAQAAKTGSRLEVGSDGRVILAQGVGVGEKPLTTGTTTRLQEQALAAKTLISRISDLRKMVTPETVGAGGVLNNMMNIVGGALAGVQGKKFKGFDKDVAITKQRIDQLQSDIMGYIRSDSGNMSDRDLTMLIQSAPKFEIASSAEKVITQIDELTDLFALKEFIARKELGDVHGILQERGTSSFSRAILLGKRNGMPDYRANQLITKALASIPQDLSNEGMLLLKDLVQSGVLDSESAISLGRSSGIISGADPNQ